MRVPTSLLAAFLVTACSAPEDPRTSLPNSDGKEDGVALRFRLSAANPKIDLDVECDQPHGCEGSFNLQLTGPEVCSLFPAESRCGQPSAGPLSRAIAEVTILSANEGTRTLPLRIESVDGINFTSSIAAAFSAQPDGMVTATITKLADAPDLALQARATWKASEDPGASAGSLLAYLATVPGLTVTEIGTAYPGYRAYRLELEQPLEHGNPSAGTFRQAMVLHHRDEAAPFVLYTSGYSLFSNDYLSELATSLGANQLSTEQRFFGTSVPADMMPASWRHVTIGQAAQDHHRIVEALRPFYAKAWVSTGHSKGGMTSIYHRRFYPGDVDATVAYVAPISYAHPDPRYLPFQDAIGEQPCRDAVRNVQRAALQQFDQIFPLAQADALAAGMTFTRAGAGGQASAFEKAIVTLEWGFWQASGITQCDAFLTPPTDAASLYYLVSSYVGVGRGDELDGFEPYYYQAAAQLGRQQLATSHLTGLLKHEQTPYNWLPEGTNPVHDPAAMTDVQQWVKTEASELLFVYGEFDPWTGGAFEIGTQSEVLKVTAPKATHSAFIEHLTAADRTAALDKLEDWLGARPNIGGPGSGGPNPALPLVP